MKQFHRYFEVLIFVLLYMMLGWIFRLNANQYLALSIPLALAFQILVRREPLVSMWVRSATQFRPDRIGVLITIVLAIPPILLLLTGKTETPWDQTLWFAISALGSIPAAFCLRNLNKANARELFYCFAVAGVIGCLLFTGAGILGHKPMTPTLFMVPDFLMNFFLLFNVTFMVEEVVFRGVLDAHIYRVGERRSWLSAIFVSVLWGLWHLPITPSSATSPVATTIDLVVFQTLVGVPLSFFWRRSGNLAVTSTTHAFIDAFRNAVLRVS